MQYLIKIQGHIIKNKVRMSGGNGRLFSSLHFMLFAFYYFTTAAFYKN